jgi:hypothetical protein
MTNNLGSNITFFDNDILVAARPAGEGVSRRLTYAGRAL